MATQTNSSSSCSCLGFLIFIFMFIAWVWGLSTPWGRFAIDLFPPKITLPQGEIKAN
jgi:hypothetical protein